MRDKILFFLFLGIFLTGAVLFGVNKYTRKQDEEQLAKQQQDLIQLKEAALQEVSLGEESSLEKSIEEILREASKGLHRKEEEKEKNEGVFLYTRNGMLKEYEKLYTLNKDLIGWLTIEDTVIDYPVMQTPEDEEYYLRRDFYGKDNQNGCLILDTDSVAGVGREERGYKIGKEPSTNLIIHGHTMKTGAMFGMLERYKEPEYGKEHSKIAFDSLYEKREYEFLAAFYSQVYKGNDEVFKYYNFFQADTQEEFDNWYENIKKMSLYDTGVSAEFGDEFITLSCCAYPDKDKRFVVVGKRVK